MATPDRLAFIIGAMKCGTTSLFSKLAHHHQVCASKPKEPAHFSRGSWTADFTDYTRIWPTFEPRIHKIALEGSTQYAKQPDFPNVAERICVFAKRYQVDCRFIYIVRDPLRMIQSGLEHGRDVGWLRGDHEALLRHLINVADFDRQLASYRERFGDEKIRVLLLEQMLIDPAPHLEALADFLGIDNDEAWSKGGFTPRNTSGQRKLRISLAQRPWAAPLRTCLEMLPVRLRTRLAPAFQALAKRATLDPSVDPSRCSLSEQEKSDIQEKLAVSMAQFAQHYAIDLSLWSSWKAR